MAAAAAAAALAPAPPAPNSPAEKEEPARLVDAPELERARIACLSERLCSWLPKSTLFFDGERKKWKAEGVWRSKRKKRKHSRLRADSLHFASSLAAPRTALLASDHSSASSPSPRHRSREDGTGKKNGEGCIQSESEGPSSSPHRNKSAIFNFFFLCLSPSATHGFARRARRRSPCARARRT